MLAIGAQFLAVPIWGWRGLFFAGILSLLPLLYIVIFVKESPVWLKVREGKEKGIDMKTATATPAMRWTDIFKGGNLKTTLLVTLMVNFLQLAYWGSGTWLPPFLVTVRGLDPKIMANFIFMLNLSAFFSFFVFGYLADHLGRRMNFIIGGLLSAVALISYMQFTSHTALFWFSIAFGFATSGFWGPLGAFMSEMFPTSVRGSGVSFAYSTSRIVGATVPLAVGGIAMKYGLVSALSLVAIVFAAVAVTAAFFLKETKNVKIV
jgi:sugar phosphate permease